jgi:hypothetical protein
LGEGSREKRQHTEGRMADGEVAPGSEGHDINDGEVGMGDDYEVEGRKGGEEWFDGGGGVCKGWISNDGAGCEVKEGGFCCHRYLLFWFTW